MNVTITAGGHPAELRRAVLPRARRPGARVRLGPADAGRPERHLRPPARRARARHHGGHRRSGLQPHRRGDRRGASASPRRPGTGSAAGADRRDAGDRPRPRPRGRRRPGARRARPLASPSRAWTARSARCAASRSRIGRGEAVGVVGESGSGKSLTALSIAQLVEEPGARRRPAPRLLRRPTCSRTGDRSDHDKLLGTSLAVVFQDPMTSFNPTMRIGGQLAEVGRHHQGLEPQGRRSARAVDRLRRRPRPRPRAPGPPVPPRVLGRHAPARHDRHGPDGHARASSSPTSRRPPSTSRCRAGARRCSQDDPPRGRRRAPAHQPRRLGRRRGLRPGAGHVRRPDRGGPAGGRPARPAHATPTPAPSSPPCRTWPPTSTQPLATIPGRPVDPAAGPGGLRVRRALPARHRPLPRAGPDARSPTRAGSRVACWHAGGADAERPCARGRDRRTAATA